MAIHELSRTGVVVDLFGNRWNIGHGIEMARRDAK